MLVLSILKIARLQSDFLGSAHTFEFGHYSNRGIRAPMPFESSQFRSGTRMVALVGHLDAPNARDLDTAKPKKSYETFLSFV